MAMVTRELNNTDGPVTSPAGLALEGKQVIFQLVDFEKRQPVSLFDAATGGEEYVVGTPITATTDAVGVFSVNLWPNSRGERATLYKVSLPGTTIKPFYISVAEGEEPLTLIQAKAAVEAVAPQTLSLFEALLNNILEVVGTATSVVTTTVNGLMAFADKVKLNFLWGMVTHVESFGSLNEAVAAIGATKRTLVFSSDITLAAPSTIPANIELVPLNGAKIINGPYDVSYLGSTARWSDRQIFDGTGNVTGLDASAPEWFGAQGGETDDTAAVQAALNSSRAVEFLKIYLVTDVTAPDTLVELYGSGLGTGLQHTDTSIAPILTAPDSAVYFHHFELIGANDTDQKDIEASANINGLEYYAMHASIFDGLTIHGFEGYGVKPIDTAADVPPYRRARAFFANCAIYYNGSAWYTGGYAVGEYVKAVNMDITHNYYGLDIACGNVTVSNSRISDNGINVWIRGSANNGHGNISNCLINHAGVYSIKATDIEYGMNFIGCNIIEGDIYIATSKGIRISDSIIDVANIILSANTGLNLIEDNRILGAAANTVVRSSDTLTVMQNNHNMALSLGANLITAWTNNGTLPFETFTASGATISSAINTADWGLAHATFAALTVGRVYELIVNIAPTGTGGRPPQIFSGVSAADANGSIPAQDLAIGKNTFYFRATANDVIVAMQSGWASSFYATATLKATDLVQ